MRMRKRLAVILAVFTLWTLNDWLPWTPPFPLHSVAQVKAQAPYPPDVWHPFRGGTNCIQVSDSQGRFNCAPGTTVDPATGNMVVGGTLSFTGGGLTSGTFSNGIALAPLTPAPQFLGAGDLVISTSPPTVAPAGPLIRGVTLRVRQIAGQCQLVVVGGNGFGEFVIPVASSSFSPQPPFNGVPTTGIPLQYVFAGGPNGC